MIDAEKLQTVSKMASDCCTDAGQDSVHFTFWPLLSAGTIHFYFDWKKSIEHWDFFSLDEAITILTKLKHRIELRG